MPRVLARRALSEARIMVPISGSAASRRWTRILNAGSRMARENATTAPTTTSASNQPQARTKSLSAITATVIKGMACSRLSNTATILGTTNAIRKPITNAEKIMMKAG